MVLVRDDSSRPPMSTASDRDFPDPIPIEQLKVKIEIPEKWFANVPAGTGSFYCGPEASLFNSSTNSATWSSPKPFSLAASSSVPHIGSPHAMHLIPFSIR